MEVSSPSRPSICIVQITRIGDVLQTLQAARQFKNEHPGIRMLLVARKQFARPLDFLLKETFDKIFYLDLKGLIGDHEDASLKRTHDNLSHFLKEIGQQSINVCINLSFSKSSNYLTSLIESKHKLGPHCNQSGHPQVFDRWGQYVYSVVMRGALNPFPLVDIYRWMLGSKQVNTLQGRGRYSKGCTVTIHPFASHGKKHWPAYKWSEILYALVKNSKKIKVNIVGSSHDGQEAVKIISHAVLKDYQDQINNLTGSTALSDVYRTISESDLFVGHDSMVGHLASLLKIQTVTLSMGTVRPYDTTPYGEGNLNLAPTIGCFPCFPTDPCQNYICQGDLTHQGVSRVLTHLLEGQDRTSAGLEKSIDAAYLSNTSIHLTQIEQDTGMNLEVISGPNSLAEIFRQFYKVLWSFILNSKDIRVKFPLLNVPLASELEKYRLAVHKLYELSDFALNYILRLLEKVDSGAKDMQGIRDLSTKLAEVETLEKSLKDGFPMLAPLVEYYYIARANVQGKDLTEITQNSVLIFKEAKDSVCILYDLIEQSLKNNFKEKSGVPNAKLAERGQ